MKRLLLSAIISLVLNAAAFVVNYASWVSRHTLPLAVKLHGGEVTVELGFGLRAAHLYGMTPDQVTTHNAAFDPISMAVCFLALLAAAYLVLFLIAKVRGR